MAEASNYNWAILEGEGKWAYIQRLFKDKTWQMILAVLTIVALIVWVLYLTVPSFKNWLRRLFVLAIMLTALMQSSKTIAQSNPTKNSLNISKGINFYWNK